MQLSLVLLVGLIICSMGCSRSANQATKTIRFLVMGQEAAVIQPIIREFEHENPSIQVKVETVSVSSSNQKLLATYMADQLPDLAQLGNTSIAAFAIINALEPIDSYLSQSRDIRRENYFTAVWDTNCINHILYGVPWYIDTRLIFYRTDLLANALVKLPIRTWGEWQTAMDQLKNKYGHRFYPVYIPLNEYEPLISFALQSDDPLLINNNQYANFNSPGFKQALHFFHQIFIHQWSPLFSITEVSNTSSEFFNGQFAMYLSGPWNLKEFRRFQPEGMASSWSTMPLPSPTGQYGGIAGGASLVIFRQSKQKKEAWEMIKFLSRPLIQAKLFTLAADLPPRREAWRQTGLASNPLMIAFQQQLEGVRPIAKVLEWDEIAHQIQVKSETVVRSGVPEALAIERLNQDVNSILEKRRWLLQREMK